MSGSYRENHLSALQSPPQSISRQAYRAGTVPITCSGWALHAPASPYARLEQDLQVDVAVIGAGLAGCSLALHLQERGIRVALLEAHQPGDGASGRNAGHVQPFLDKLGPLKTWPGAGQPFVDYFIEQRNIVYEMCQTYGIDGDAYRGGMIEAATKPQASLLKKAKEWRQRGYAVEEVGQAQLQGLLGTDRYAYGLRWDEGGSLNPYMFTNGMARIAQSLGANVYGNSPVLACEREQQRWRVKTQAGSVLADQVVICTNAHAQNGFFPELARTQYLLVACAMATQPLPQEVLNAVNPGRAAFTQVPTGLYPMVVDGLGRLITATIPHVGREANGSVYFDYFLTYLRKTFPVLRETSLELESYWTGYTSSSSQIYHEDYAKIYQVADGVTALMNLGTWGNVMGPMLGRHLAQVMASDRWQDLLLPLEQPKEVSYPQWFDFKMRRVLVPVARALDKFGLA